MSLRRILLSVAAFLLVGGCTTTSSSDWDLPTGEQAYSTIPATIASDEREEYRLNSQDKLTITVFREPDLSVVEAPVETSGGIVLPLIGRVQASGRTTSELAADIESRLGGFLVQPKVSVIVAESQSLNVTVDGAVGEAGVYEMKGDTTLLQSIAMAKGASRLADLDRVAVFRTINGQRHGAIFDVAAIQAGKSSDLLLKHGDYVVVGASNIKAIWYDVLAVVPSFALFVPLLN